MILKEVLLIFLLILINGFFAMAELAIVSARKTRLQSDLGHGDRLAKKALDVISAPKHALSTVQVGITLVGVIASVYGGAIIAERIHDVLKDIAWLEEYSWLISYGTVVVLISYLSLVIGELFPKRLALAYPEAITKLVSPMLIVCATIFKPLVWLLNSSADFLEAIFFLHGKQDEKVIEDEIRLMLAQGAEQGLIHRAEEKIVAKAFRLDDRDASSIMTPRKELEWIDVNDDASAIWEQISSSEHSDFILADGNIEKVIGIISAKDIAGFIVAGRRGELRELACAPLQVASNMNLLRVLEVFKTKKQHRALVYDEYGGLDGLITTHDLMEALVGDLSDSPDDEPEYQRRPDGSLLIDASMDLDELFISLGLPLVLHEDHKGYHSLGGFIMKHLGHVPVRGESFEYLGYKFEVVAMDRHRVAKVLITGEPAEKRAEE